MKKSYKNFSQLSFSNSHDLNEVSTKLFNHPYSEYGKKFWYNIIVKKLKKNKKLYFKLMKMNERHLISSDKITKDIIFALQDGIEEIKLN